MSGLGTSKTGTLKKLDLDVYDETKVQTITDLLQVDDDWVMCSCTLHVGAYFRSTS